MTESEILKQAVKVLQIEAQSIDDLSKKIDSSFEELVNEICSSNGRVVITGIGKSGLIGKKIVATLVSTGTNSIFLHPVEALHGDLGVVSKNDVILAISNSGETKELHKLIPLMSERGCKIACFTGDSESTLAGLSDIVVSTGVEREACPFNLTPTSSTTAQLAMGDALAIVLIKKKKFQQSDFKLSHPGGKLGQRLSSRVAEIMLDIKKTPTVFLNTKLSAALKVIDRFRLGAVIILDKNIKLKGIITDGDIRHCIATDKPDFNNLTVDSIMTCNPRTLTADSFLYDALNLMEKFQITVLPIVNVDNELEGILHLHDILGKGSFKFNGGGNKNV